MVQPVLGRGRMHGGGGGNCVEGSFLQRPGRDHSLETFPTDRELEGKWLGVRGGEYGL